MLPSARGVPAPKSKPKEPAQTYGAQEPRGRLLDVLDLREAALPAPRRGAHEASAKGSCCPAALRSRKTSARVGHPFKRTIAALRTHATSSARPSHCGRAPWYSLLAPAAVQLPPQLSGDGLQVHEVAEAAPRALPGGWGEAEATMSHAAPRPPCTAPPRCTPSPTPSRTGGNMPP